MGEGTEIGRGLGRGGRITVAPAVLSTCMQRFLPAASQGRAAAKAQRLRARVVAGCCA